eukprot:scaffold286157_cov30-Tisochrysis_lutea.AAC.1
MAMGMIPSAWLMVKSVYDENRRRRRRTLSNSRRARDPGSITFTQAFDTPTTPPALAPQKACTDYGRNHCPLYGFGRRDQGTSSAGRGYGQEAGWGQAGRSGAQHNEGHSTRKDHKAGGHRRRTSGRKAWRERVRQIAGRKWERGARTRKEMNGAG